MKGLTEHRWMVRWRPAAYPCCRAPCWNPARLPPLQPAVPGAAVSPLPPAPPSPRCRPTRWLPAPATCTCCACACAWGLTWRWPTCWCTTSTWWGLRFALFWPAPQPAALWGRAFSALPASQPPGPSPPPHAAKGAPLDPPAPCRRCWTSWTGTPARLCSRRARRTSKSRWGLGGCLLGRLASCSTPQCLHRHARSAAGLQHACHCRQALLSAAKRPIGAASPATPASLRCASPSCRPSWQRSSSSGRGPAERLPLMLSKPRRCSKAAVPPLPLSRTVAAFVVRLTCVQASLERVLLNIMASLHASPYQLLNVQRGWVHLDWAHASGKVPLNLLMYSKIRVKRGCLISTSRQNFRAAGCGAAACHQFPSRAGPLPSRPAESASLSCSCLPSPQSPPCRGPCCTPCGSGWLACRQSEGAGKGARALARPAAGSS